MTPWLRLYVETPNDPKLRVIAAECNTPVAAVLAVWISMLCHAGARPATERGSLEGWDVDTVAIVLGISPELVGRIRAAMEGRLVLGDRLSAWDRRQFERDHSTPRVQAWRKRQALLKAAGTDGEKVASKRTETRETAQQGTETRETARNTQNQNQILSPLTPLSPDLFPPRPKPPASTERERLLAEKVRQDRQSFIRIAARKAR